MPTYVVTGPDGAKYRVTAPEGATEQDVMARVQAQAQKPDRQGAGTAIAQRSAAAVKGAAWPVTFLEDAGRAIGAGVNYVTDKVGTTALRAVGADRAADWWEGAGNAYTDRQRRMPTVRSAVEAIVPAPRDAAGQTADLIAEVLAGMSVPVGPKATAAIPRLPRNTPSPRPVRTANYTPRRNPVTGRPVAAEAAPPSSPIFPELAPMGREAQVRAAQLQRAGVARPTTGMVTRNPRVWRAEQEFAKLEGTGDDFASQLQEVQSNLADNARNIVSRQGGALGAEEVGTRVSKALADKSDEMQQQIGALYRGVRETRGDVSAGPLNRVRAMLDDPDMMDNPAFDKMRDGLMRRMQRFGMAGNSGLLRNESIATINQAEELRKLVGGLGDGKDPAIRMMRARLIDAIDDDVVEAVGDDAFRAGRDAARARFAEFKNTFPGRVAETDKPERLGRQLVGQGTGLNDLRSLVGSLTSGTERQVERGSDALRALRAQAIDDLVSPHISPEGTINGGGIYKRFFDNQDRYRAILDPGTYKELRRFAVAARNATVDVPLSNVNRSNTASAAINQLFPDMPPMGQQGMLGRVARRIAGMAPGVGGFAADAADATARELANLQMAKAASRQIELASNPALAAREALARALPQSLRGQSGADASGILARYLTGGAIAGGGRVTNEAAGGLARLLESPVAIRAAAGDSEKDKKKKKRKP